ncbi:MAG: hypothetical protein ACR2F8_09430 [Caulobacteraceae bacterium]
MSATLAATIAPGPFVGAGPSSSNTFPTNHVTVTGGSGSFTYLWTETDNGGAGWSSGGTAATYAPKVSGVGDGSSASYTCTVTDTRYGLSAPSNRASYFWRNISG